MIHQIYNANNDLYYAQLLKIKKIFLKGGANRMKHTLPPLIFCLFKLSAQLEASIGVDQGATTDEDGAPLIKADQNKIFKNVNEIILAIQDSGQ